MRWRGGKGLGEVAGSWGKEGGEVAGSWGKGLGEVAGSWGKEGGGVGVRGGRVPSFTGIYMNCKIRLISFSSEVINRIIILCMKNVEEERDTRKNQLQ